MRNKKLYAFLTLIIAFSLLTACGAPEAAAPAAEPAPAAQEAAPETNALAEEASLAEEATPVEEEPAPLTADLITYEGVLDDTDIFDGDTVALHAISDLEVYPSEICADFHFTEAVQQKVAVTDTVHMIRMTIDNKTDQILYPVACPGSLTVNGQPVADERFVLVTLNTVLEGINFVIREYVDPGESASMAFLLLAGEEALPELTGLDHVETVEISFDLKDEAGNTVDTATVEIAAFRPLTEEELSAKENGVSAGNNLEGVIEILGTELEFMDDGSTKWLGRVSFRNIGDESYLVRFTSLCINGVVCENLGGGSANPGEEWTTVLCISGEDFNALGLTSEADITSLSGSLEVCPYDPNTYTSEEPIVIIEDYPIL